MAVKVKLLSGRRYVFRKKAPATIGTGRRGIYKKGKKTTFYKKVQRAIMTAQETKYFQGTHTTNFAANNTAGTGEGYGINAVAVPGQGTGVGQRTGNKWVITGIHCNFRIQLSPQANTNYPITGTIMLVKLKEGGPTFPWGDFLVQDPMTSSYSMNSLRAIEHFNDFVVLRKKRVYVGPDNFANNTNGYSFSFNWKGYVPQSAEPGNQSVCASNSLFWIYLADTGFLSGASNNYLTTSQTYNVYYKDA